MINHSGQIGSSYREPVKMHDIDISFRPVKPVKKMFLLNSDVQIQFNKKGDRIECTVPQINEFLCFYE